MSFTRKLKLIAANIIADAGVVGAENIITPSLSVGSSGSAGTVSIFPSTDAKGKVTLTTADNTGDTTTGITVAAQAAARTYTVPDAMRNSTFMFYGGSVTDAGPMTATGGSVGEVVRNTSDSKVYLCTVAHASAATWVALN
jgi:hypothetical protein